MSEQPDSHVRAQGGLGSAAQGRQEAYEPPALVVLGTFAELTQQLKISGSADLVNFQPSHT